MSGNDKSPFGPTQFIDLTNYQPRAGKTFVFAPADTGARLNAAEYQAFGLTPEEVGKIKQDQKGIA